MSLFSRKRGKQPAIGAQCMPVRRLSYQCAACQGVGSREYQEDAWTLVNAGDVNMIRERGLLALVADGMGGLSNGDLASRTGLQTVSEDYADMDITDDLEGQLAQSVLHACQTVYERLQGTGGSTIVACIVCNEALYYAGLGDSFLYLLRRGKLTRINREQNMLHQHYRERIRRRQMAAVSAENVSQAQAVTAFLGVDQVEDLDFLNRSMPLENHDVLLLCSDGVGGVLSQEEIGMCLSIPDANEAARALQNAVLAKGLAHQDNFTAVVIRCEK